MNVNDVKNAISVLRGEKHDKKPLPIVVAAVLAAILDYVDHDDTMHILAAEADGKLANDETLENLAWVDNTEFYTG